MQKNTNNKLSIFYNILYANIQSPVECGVCLYICVYLSIYTTHSLSTHTHTQYHNRCNFFQLLIQHSTFCVDFVSYCHFFPPLIYLFYMRSWSERESAKSTQITISIANKLESGKRHTIDRYEIYNCPPHINSIIFIGLICIFSFIVFEIHKMRVV